MRKLRGLDWVVVGLLVFQLLVLLALGGAVAFVYFEGCR